MSQTENQQPKRYDNKFKIDYQTETEKAELHTGKDTPASISLSDNEVLIEDSQGNTLTLDLNEASMFHQALNFLINVEKEGIPTD